MLLFIIIFTVCFVIFSEWYIGSIMFRPDSSNIIRFNLFSMVNFLYHPLHNSFLWNWEIIIVNYPCMLGLGILINLIITHK